MAIISERHKVLFVHQEKCGGTSVKHAWQKVAKWGDFIIGGTKGGEAYQDYFISSFNLNKHSSISELGNAIGPERFGEFESYALIRSPVEIVVSFFYFPKRVRARICKRKGWDATHFRNLIKEKSDEAPRWMHNNPIIHLALDLEDLDEFCTLAARHFKRDFLSRKFCIGGELAIDHLISLAEIEDIESRLNERYEIGLSIGHDNKSQKSLNRPSNKVLNMLRNRFKSDIDRFKLQSIYDE